MCCLEEYIAVDALTNGNVDLVAADSVSKGISMVESKTYIARDTAASVFSRPRSSQVTPYIEVIGQWNISAVDKTSEANEAGDLVNLVSIDVTRSTAR